MRDAPPATTLPPATAGSTTVRIVKKTLKGNLLGDARVRAAATKRERSGDGGVAELPTRLKPRTQASLDALVKDDDVVVITEPLKASAGKPIPIGKPERPEPAWPGPPPAGAPPAVASPPAATARAVPPRPAVPEVRPEGLRGARRGPAAASPPAPAVLVPARPSIGDAAPGTRLEGDAVSLARAVLAGALLKDLGEAGSELRQPKGTMFHVDPRRCGGVVRTQHPLTLPLPTGHVVAHEADLVIELDNRATLVVDIVPSHATPETLKARSFDAILMRRLDNALSVLLCVRSPGPGLPQDQVEAIAHGYDLQFSVDAEQAHSEAKYGALRNRIVAWLEAAGGRRR